MKSKILLLVLAIASLAETNLVAEARFMDGGPNPSGDDLLFSSPGWPGVSPHRSIQNGKSLFRSFRPPDYSSPEPTNKLTVDMWLNIDTFISSDELIYWAENINPTNARTFEINANDTGGTVTVYLISETGTNGGFFSRPSGTNHFAIVMDRTTGTNCGVTVYTNGVLAPFTQTHAADMNSSNFESDSVSYLTRGEPGRHSADKGVIASFRILFRETSAETLYLRGLPSQPLPKRNWFGEIVN